jgi:SET domain-containing protein 6
MAYSFTDSDSVDAKPAMVPMADILNHISDNNAHLEFGEEFLSMVTTQRVHKVDMRISSACQQDVFATGL